MFARDTSPLPIGGVAEYVVGGWDVEVVASWILPKDERPDTGVTGVPML